MARKQTNTRSHNSIAPFFLALSALIMVASLIGGAVLAMDSGGGGFFPNLGKALGLVLIAAGNLLSWILNLFCWYGTRMRWLGIVLAIQGVPAIFFAGSLAVFGLDAFLEDRALDQRARVHDAIKADDVPAVQQALARCGKQCQEFLSFQRKLMFASWHRSHQTARYLLDNGAVPAKPGSADDFYNARTDLYTCEGSYLPSLGALDLAVANQDVEMLELLWPVISDDWTRSKTLWTAARLDRLDMVKFMADIGNTPVRDPENKSTAAHAPQPLVRERHGGKQETLLRAAASGAAVEVGRWLLETRPIALSQDEIQRALTDLLAFALEIETSRSISFARILLRHGADIHSVKIYDEPALERAVSFRSKPLVTMLLELGADPGRLSDKDAAQLDALLQEPGRRSTYRQNRQGCVAL